MKVVNECRIVFKYQLSPESIVVCRTIFSNIVSTQILNDILSVEKYADKKETCMFDIITYTIIIKNINSSIITNVYFKDELSNNLRFIKNSVKINDIRKKCINVEDGFDLGNLAAKNEIKVEFKVLVLKCVCKSIKNFSEIFYDYIYNVEKEPKRMLKYSNCAVTSCTKELFKQFSVCNTLKICDCINNITDIRCEALIVKTKVLNITLKSLNTLLVIGKIKYYIGYKSEFNEKLLESIFGFSENMLVPDGINYLGEENIKICIENMSAQLINKNTISVNTDLLLHY